MAIRKATGSEVAPRRISLEVPKDVNLSSMSDAEIERLALDMSRKAAANLPKGTVLAGVEGVTLRQVGVGVEVGWSRGCGRADLSREGLVVNPEIFVDRLRMEGIQDKSARITIATKGAPSAKRAAGKSKKSKKK